MDLGRAVGKVERRAAQQEAVADQPALAGRAGIDHQRRTEPTRHRLMGVAVEQYVLLDLAEVLEAGAVRIEIGEVVRIGGRMRQQQAAAGQLHRDLARAAGEPVEQLAVDPVGHAGALAVAAEEAGLVVAPDGQRVAAAQLGDDLVRETILVDRVAEADEPVDRAHQRDRAQQAGQIAVQVRYDADPHGDLRQAAARWRANIGPPRWSGQPSPFTRTMSMSPGR